MEFVTPGVVAFPVPGAGRCYKRELGRMIVKHLGAPGADVRAKVCSADAPLVVFAGEHNEQLDYLKTVPLPAAIPLADPLWCFSAKVVAKCAEHLQHGVRVVGRRLVEEYTKKCGMPDIYRYVIYLASAVAREDGVAVVLELHTVASTAALASNIRI